MPLGFLISACVLAVLMCLMHVLSVFVRRGTWIFVSAGIILHVSELAILFFGGAAFEVAILVMLASLLVYVTLSFIKYQISAIKERSGENDV